MVTVASFPDLASAELALALLESEGVPASIPNAQLIGVDWQLSNAVGGIVVQVAPEQENKAREVLSSAPPEALPAAPTVEPESHGPACPKCGSRFTRPDPAARRMVALSLLFPPAFLIAGPTYFFTRGRFECSACGALWRPPKALDAA